MSNKSNKLHRTSLTWFGVNLKLFHIKSIQRPLGLSCFCELSLNAWFQLTRLCASCISNLDFWWFFLQNFFFVKNFSSQCWQNISFGENFFAHKICKIFLAIIFFWENFFLQKIFWQKLCFGNIFVFGKHFFVGKKNLAQFFFGKKIFFSANFLFSKHFFRKTKFLGKHVFWWNFF